MTGRLKRRNARVLSGRVALGVAVLVSALLLWHGVLPEDGGIRLIVESFLPLLVIVPVAAILIALARRFFGSVVVLLIPLVIAGITIGPGMVPLTTEQPTSALGSPSAGTVSATPRFTITSQNLDATALHSVPIMRALIAGDSDVLVLEEVTDQVDGTTGAIPLAVTRTWPHRYRVGTVMLLSKYPISHAEPLTLGLTWKRAIHADVATPVGSVSLYAVHADSVRLERPTDRNTMLRTLGTLVKNDSAPRVIVAGDFNAARNDSALTPFHTLLSEPAQSGGGLGFTWPASFPLVRPDHIFARGLLATAMNVLPASGSDHRAITATFTAIKTASIN